MTVDNPPIRRRVTDLEGIKAFVLDALKAGYGVAYLTPDDYTTFERYIRVDCASPVMAFHGLSIRVEPHLPAQTALALKDVKLIHEAKF